MSASFVYGKSHRIKCKVLSKLLINEVSKKFLEITYPNKICQHDAICAAGNLRPKYVACLPFFDGLLSPVSSLNLVAPTEGILRDVLSDPLVKGHPRISGFYRLLDVLLPFNIFISLMEYLILKFHFFPLDEVSVSKS